MQKLLRPERLGVSGRQSELIEVALTYGFKSLATDMDQYLHQVDSRGLQHASRFLKSAPVASAAFELPFPWYSPQETFAQDMAELPKILEAAKTIGSDTCLVTLLASSDLQDYQQNFEFHSQRLSDLAGFLSQHEFRLGLNFQADVRSRTEFPVPFACKPDVLTSLLMTNSDANMGAVVDVWDWHVGGGTVEQLEQIDAERVFEIRISDVPADANSDELTSQHRLMPSTSPTIDLQGYLTRLHDRGCTAPICVFPDPKQAGNGRLDSVVKAASESLDYWIARGKGEPLPEEEEAVQSDTEEPPSGDGESSDTNLAATS